MKNIFFIPLIIIFLSSNIYASIYGNNDSLKIPFSTIINYELRINYPVLCFLGPIPDPYLKINYEKFKKYFLKNLPLTVDKGFIRQKNISIKIAFFFSSCFPCTDFGQNHCQKNILPSLKQWHETNKINSIVYASCMGAATYINCDKKEFPKLPCAIILESPLFFPNSAISHFAKINNTVLKKIVPHVAPLIFFNYKPDGNQPLHSSFFETCKETHIPIIIAANKKDDVVPIENSYALYYATCKAREHKTNKNVYLIETEGGDKHNHLKLFNKHKAHGMWINDIAYMILKKYDIVDLLENEDNSIILKQSHYYDNDEVARKILEKINSKVFEPDYQNYKKYYDTYCEWHKFDKKYATLFGFMRKAVGITTALLFFYASQKIASLFLKKIRGKPFFVKSIIESLKRRIANSYF